MRVDHATRHIGADAERVFRAFIDPDLFVSWIPPEGMSGRLEQFDAERGYRMVLTYDHPPDGGGKASVDSDVSVVRRVRVDPPRLLVEEVDFPSVQPAFAGTMRMTWTFDAEQGGTLVAVEATDVPAGIDQDVHIGAMISSLAQLAHAVEHGTAA
ncbi:SRPBCC domain-containing protein [Microbacterium sp. RD1]|uniref:SRPBCC domain-containing protein n=1 Tax=Microbacterium sp. RD1 TaxID=3457313 RepID=UPI003FA56B9D